MTHCVGIDVSLETSSICIVDETGLTAREFVVDSEPEALAAALLATGLAFTRVGLEAGCGATARSSAGAGRRPWHDASSATTRSSTRGPVVGTRLDEAATAPGPISVEPAY